MLRQNRSTLKFKSSGQDYMGLRTKNSSFTGLDLYLDKHRTMTVRMIWELLIICFIGNYNFETVRNNCRMALVIYFEVNPVNSYR